MLSLFTIFWNLLDICCVEIFYVVRLSATFSRTAVLGVPGARLQRLRGPELRELEQEDPTLLEVRVHRLFGFRCCKGFYVARNVPQRRFW